MSLAIIFWLMPVMLLVVLILLVLAMLGHQRTLRRLTVIEPLGWLVRTWQVARLEPNNQTLAGLFKVIASSNLSKGTLLEQIIASAAGTVSLKSKPTNATLIEHRLIGPLAEQFVLTLGTKKKSVLIGPLEQIESLIDDEKIAKFRALSQKSAQNGYLALTIATSFIHGEKMNSKIVRGGNMSEANIHSDKPKMTNHRLEGIVVLEPSIDQSRVALIQRIGHEQTRFLTVLPFGVATHLYGQVFPDQMPFGLNAKELETLLPPKFAEADLEKAAVVGGADIVARHQALRVWQQKHSCVVVSVNPEDRDLPIMPISHLS